MKALHANLKLDKAAANSCSGSAPKLRINNNHVCMCAGIGFWLDTVSQVSGFTYYYMYDCQLC